MRQPRQIFIALRRVILAAVLHATDRRKLGVHCARRLVSHHVARTIGGRSAAHIANRLLVHALILLLSVLAVGCGTKTIDVPTVVREVVIQEVKVPIQVERVPPEALLAALKPPLPVFVAPTDPEASSALTPEGERLLLGLLEELLQRIEAWKKWSTAKE